MKRVISILMVLIMVCMTSISIADGHNDIFDDVYDFWKDLNKDIIDICNDHYMDKDQEFINDGYYYIVGYELGLAEPYTYDNLNEYEECIEDIFRTHGVKHVDCHVHQIGRGNTMNVLYLEINTMTKLREIEGCIPNYQFDFDDGSEVYCVRIICYEHVN